MPSLPRSAFGDPHCSGRSGRQARPNPSRIALHAPRCRDSLFCWRLQRDGPAFSDRPGGGGLSIAVAVFGRPGLNSLRVLHADQVAYAWGCMSRRLELSQTDVRALREIGISPGPLTVLLPSKEKSRK
jgi:hypothetical protein